MSTVATSSVQLQNARPSFIGLLSGELFKVTRLRIFWVLAVLLLCFVLGPHLIVVTAQNSKDQLTSPEPGRALTFMYNEMFISLALVRIFIGIFLMIVTSFIIGLEYQLGTIRILVSRGVGKLQLLGAKVAAVVIIALVVLAVCLLLSLLAIMLTVLILTGNFDKFSVLTSAFWNNTWLYLLTVLISMGATILMAVAMNVIARSLSFGLSLTLAYFPIDNIGIFIIATLAYRVTHLDFWNQVTAYMLGLNLNYMPNAILPADLNAGTVGVSPLVKVDGPHTLWVTLAYSVVFAVIAIVLTVRRDIKE